LVDDCRLIAAFGIVWFHTEVPGYLFGYVAAPLFVLLLSLPSRWPGRRCWRPGSMPS
jgi:hypothetical protein